MTSFEEFSAMCMRGNVVPVFETLRADTETPVSLYLKIQNQSPYSFLLESVEGGEHVGRYSFLGVNPFMKCEIRGDRLQVEAFHDDVTTLPSLVLPDESPLISLKKIFAHLKTVRVPGLPRFTGGAVGYFGYECVGLVEEVPQADADQMGIPDSLLFFYDVVIVVDNATRSIVLVSNAYVPDNDRSAERLNAEYIKAREELVRLRTILEAHELRGGRKAAEAEEGQFLTSKRAFCEMVSRAKEYIAGGDIFQVVLSQRLQQQSDAEHFAVYRNLRVINPSPYMYFLRAGELSVIGSSPEMLVRVVDRAVETRPIAGTRRRGATEEEDRSLEQELSADPKEKAEHLMLVDLSRNDLGRICEFGSVRVASMMKVERYSHVMHLVSEVTGSLRKELSSLDALFSCFPAGTVSGAPKIRAMEIIAELESLKRGIYGGAVVYLDFSGNIDSCIAIRTIVAKGEMFYLQAGAGIVHDSVPEREYEETLEKLGATVQALKRDQS